MVIRVRVERRENVVMSITAQAKMILDQLDETEMSLVSSYASSLIRNRGEHTEAYHRFQEFRERMLKKNPMTVEEIDSITRVL